MIDYRLCNVLMSDGNRTNDYPDLYYKQKKPIGVEDGQFRFSQPSYSKYDFATYFNAFSFQKWKRYTVIDNVWIRIVARGSFRVEFTEYRATQAAPKRDVVADRKYDFDDYGVVDFEYPADTDAALLAFEITTFSMLDVKEIYYYTKIDESKLRDVELAVATTTFQKEDFILPNIELVKREVLGCDEPIAGHFTFHVVDNGRTLDKEALEGSGVFIHPNPNVGGAGGFTRGMIEAMEQEHKATHVLLMDDDVQISPESLKRTYNLLTLVNDEYVDAFLSGAMLSYEKQDEFYEDIGYVRHYGVYGPVKNHADLSRLEDIVRLETVQSKRGNKYAGWWYCCIPMTSIDKYGLPLPLFIRGDDAEYGNRCSKHFITLNGICIWHLTLAYKFRAAFERYQVPRNSLIAQATTGIYQDVDFIRNFKDNVQLDLKTFNYDAVELSLQAIEDFMKGPDFIKQADGSALIKELTKKNDKLLPIDQIDEYVIDSVEFDPQFLYQPQNRTFFQRAFDYLTVNGHRFVPKFMLKDDVAVIPYDGWYYAPNQIRRHTKLLSVTRDGREALYRTMDRARFKPLYKRYKKDLALYERNKKSIDEAYSNARKELTSVEFWKHYLGI